MADVTGGEKTAGIFWIKDSSDEDQPMVFVPGVSEEGNLRPGAKVGSGGVRKGKMRMGNGSELKGIVGVGCQLEEKKNRFHRPCCQAKTQAHATQAKAMLHSASTAGPSLRPPVLSPTKPIYINTQALAKSVQARSSASLKDLCPEDKRRIANLIEELARVSEEKDESKQRLKDEQESFERKIQQLEEQNQLIVQEREGLQQQYRECQELLGLYQEYLSQQKEKLNHSIAHLHHSHSKVSSREGPVGPPARGGAAGLDGSYLDPPATGGAWPATPALLSSSSGRDSERSQGRGQRSEPRQGPSQTCGSRPCFYEDGPSPAARRPPRAPATAPPPGRVDWDERRNWLLLQKMELEVQREKLQAQLAQQEERLFLHNQTLRQSRMESSKFRDRAAEPEADRVALSGAAESNQTPRVQDRVAEPEADRVALRGAAGSNQTPRGSAVLGRVRAPSRESEDLDRIAAQQEELLQRGEMAALPLHKPPQSNEASAVSRRDAATSPAVAQSQPSALAPGLPRTPSSRLHSSLIDLLDTFSPLSAPIQRRGRPTRKPRTPGLSSVLPPWAPPQWAPPPQRAPPHPRRAPRPRSPSSPVEDAEESQILDDIFFIC
ncbi:protein hinderin isoform X1 [Conger conger]|uniref:protein hinderin isoform X1 n=2 Tax=Conger conger TaxID=82655 RepID=UPI002A5A05EC|nr:protein hinderin isoform X1 [Conger conger]